MKIVVLPEQATTLPDPVLQAPKGESTTGTAAAPQPRSEVSPALLASQEQLKKDLDQLKAQTLAGLLKIQERFEQTQSKGLEQVRQNAAELVKLTEEVTALRRRLDELPKPPLATPAPAQLPKPVDVSKPVEPPKPVDGIPVLPDFQPTLKKVAIFEKLWDYLNQVAFDDSIRKSNRAE